MPLIRSAGQVAHHPTTSTESPSAEAMFQTAGTLRLRPVIGAICPVSGSFSTKSSTPCTSADTPVAIVVQIRGDSIGTRVVIVPQVPASISRFRLGIRPASTHGRTRSQSRPSRPRTSTLWRGSESPAAISPSRPARTSARSGSRVTATAPSGTPSDIASAWRKKAAGSGGQPAGAGEPSTKQASGRLPTVCRTVSATLRRSPSPGVSAAASCHTPTGGASSITVSTLAPSAVAAGTSAANRWASSRSPDHLGAIAGPPSGTRSRPVSACPHPQSAFGGDPGHRGPQHGCKNQDDGANNNEISSRHGGHSSTGGIAQTSKKGGPEGPPGNGSESLIRRTDARRDGPWSDPASCWPC